MFLHTVTFTFTTSFPVSIQNQKNSSIKLNPKVGSSTSTYHGYSFQKKTALIQVKVLPKLLRMKQNYYKRNKLRGTVISTVLFCRAEHELWMNQRCIWDICSFPLTYPHPHPCLLCRMTQCTPTNSSKPHKYNKKIFKSCLYCVFS